MKKRMFLTTVLMTLVLLVAVTTATFAWYTATMNNSSTSTTLASSKNSTVGASMSASASLINLNGNAATVSSTAVVVDGKTTGYTIALGKGEGDTTSSLSFLPCVHNAAEAADTAAKSNTTVTGTASEWKTYVQQNEGDTVKYYQDTATKGIAALVLTFTIAGSQYGTAQQLGLKMNVTVPESNSFSALNWAFAYNVDGALTNGAGETYTVSNANYTPLQVAGQTGYLLNGFKQPVNDVTVQVYLWINGCTVNDNTASAAGGQTMFEFSLVPATADAVVSTAATTIA